MSVHLTKGEAGQDCCPTCGHRLPKQVTHGKNIEWVDPQKLKKFLEMYHVRGSKGKSGQINGVDLVIGTRQYWRFYKMVYWKKIKPEIAEDMLAHFGFDPHIDRFR